MKIWPRLASLITGILMLVGNIGFAAAASVFYPAEEYHQDYYKKNPIRYAYYRKGCGRTARVHEIWGGK